MTKFLGTLWKEVVWVATPTKHGNISIEYVDYWNLLCPLPMALGILGMRYVLTRYCYEPLGEHLGLKKTKVRRAPSDPVLESMYMKWKNVPRAEILGMAKQLDMTERQVERWLRQRRNQDRPSVLAKFCQNCWRCTYYTLATIYGVIVLWNKPWFWDITQCWTGYPTCLAITKDIWWYYMISLSFYWSLFFGQFFFDVKRKDFWQMFVHHVAAILLLCFSWLAGVYKIGTLVLIVHDCGDMILEAAKAAKYVEYQKTCTVLFCVFTVVWLVTRLGIYPFWIIKHTMFDALKFVPDFPAYYTFNVLLVLLLILHCFWTYLILKVAVNSLGAGEVSKDVRSDSDEESGRDD